ncbi:MAG: murein transglycosylase domain-containing protein [Candidatus Neomarinimicrobiota bacterium]
MRHILKNIFLYFGTTLLSQQSFEDFKNQQNSKFQEYKFSITNEYEAFEKSEIESLKKFKKDIELKWEEYKGSSNKVYVSYDDDLQSRALIDFERGQLSVEIILDDQKIEQGSLNFYKNESKYFRFSQNVYPSIYASFLLNLNNFIFQNADHIRSELDNNKGKPVFENIAEKKLIKKLLSIISEKGDDGTGILEGQLSDKKGQTVIKGKNDKQYANEKILNASKNINKYKSKDGRERTSYKVDIRLSSDHQDKRIKKYKKEIVKQANRFKIDPSIAMAITETESSFNPKATSHIPAYGLMQLVPKSGARDAYNYVYKKDKYLNKRYLYKPKNNIELGCAYLSKIRYEYFKGIKDSDNAYLCTIAAYNTGAGNVAKALTSTTKLKPTSKKVNRMSSEKLYNTLIKDLKYKETQNYLKKVWSRKDKYKKI